MLKSTINLKEIVLFNILFGAGYVLLFIVQHFIIFKYQILLLNVGLFSGTLIFIPHGIRVMAALVGGYFVMPGLLIGHLLSAFIYDQNFIIENLIRSILSVIAIYIPYSILKKNRDIKLKNILIIAFISSLLNAFFQTEFLYFTSINVNHNSLITTYLAGDIIGSLCLFYIIKLFKQGNTGKPT